MGDQVPEGVLPVCMWLRRWQLGRHHHLTALALWPPALASVSRTTPVSGTADKDLGGAAVCRERCTALGAQEPLCTEGTHLPLASEAKATVIRGSPS